MRTLALLLSLFVFVFPVLAQKPSPKSDADDAQALAAVRSAIDQGNALWIQGWLKGDAAMVASVFAEDGVQLSNGGKVIRGREQIKQRQQAAMDGVKPGVVVTITTTNVWLDGDTAYETGKYKYEYVEKDKPGIDQGRYLTIWKRQKDGSWKLAMDTGIPND